MKKFAFVFLSLSISVFLIAVIATGANNVVVYNSDIFYRIDEQTGLCFAHSGRSDSQTLANVPCTEKVIELSK